MACLGVAGPIVEGIAISTHLLWRIAEKTIEQSLHIKKTVLINDLVANAYGIRVLRGKDFETLNIGKKQQGNAAVLSGAGLFSICQFLRGSGRFGARPDCLADQMKLKDPAAVIA